MSLPALQIHDLTVTYPNGFRALHQVNLTVPEDGTVGLVGGSGCGKTTLVRAILGLLPTGSRVSGSVTVGGRELLGLDERVARSLRGTLVGYVAQDPFSACDPMRRVRHHIEEAWRAHRSTPPHGAVVGGLAVGVIENLAGTYIPVVGPELKLPVALFVIVAVLVVRPSGIWGRRTVQRV